MGVRRKTRKLAGPSVEPSVQESESLEPVQGLIKAGIGLGLGLRWKCSRAGGAR